MQRRLILTGAGGVASLATAAILSARAMGGMAEYDADVAALRRPLPAQPGLLDLIRYATLAANGHNTQPWRFRLREGGVDIRPDLERRTPVVDPGDHHLFVSLGCAAENLALAAASSGRPGRISFDPAAGGAVAFRFADVPPESGELFSAIAQRQSTRAEYDGRPVSAALLATLATAAAVPGVALVLLTDRPRMANVRDLVIAGNSRQMADPAFMQELAGWLRFNPREAIAHGDGLFSATSGRGTTPTWLGPTLFRNFAIVTSKNDAYARQIQFFAGLAVFVAEQDDPEHWVRVGRASQRFALQATALGLKHAFLNQPVEVAALRPALAGLVGFAGYRPNLVMRFGHGPTLPYAARRPVRSVMVVEQSSQGPPPPSARA